MRTGTCGPARADVRLGRAQVRIAACMSQLPPQPEKDTPGRSGESTDTEAAAVTCVEKCLARICDLRLCPQDGVR